MEKLKGADLKFPEQYRLPYYEQFLNIGLFFEGMKKQKIEICREYQLWINKVDEISLFP